MTQRVKKAVIQIVEDLTREAILEVLEYEGFSDVQMIWNAQGGLEPKGTYVVGSTLLRRRTQKEDRATFLEYDTDLMYWKEHYNWHLQLSVIGKEAVAVAEVLDDSIPANQVHRERFVKRSLSYMSKSSLQRNPQKRESGFVELWNLDLEINYSVQLTQVMDYIEFVVIGGETYRILPEEDQIRTLDSGEKRTVEDEVYRKVNSTNL